MGILTLAQGLFNGTAFITTPGMLGCIDSSKFIYDGAINTYN